MLGGVSLGFSKSAVGLSAIPAHDAAVVRSGNVFLLSGFFHDDGAAVKKKDFISLVSAYFLRPSIHFQQLTGVASLQASPNIH
ncbi:hypothetical protein [Terriglobus roseus]|uniref:hypothetical protein n=1 Tax=Terriglobus roseus TaxID=392734 RepID=UPI0002DB98AA|nr:hypothetical protein [Terriglobus roseus]